MKKPNRINVPDQNDATEQTSALSKELVGKRVIVRANVAGVHCGIVTHLDTATSTVALKDAYRLWRIYTRDASGSISDVAANGLKTPLSQHSIGTRLETVVIVNPPGLEIAVMTDAAYDSVVAAAPKAA